ncbi:hypothetical protein D6850_10755 [Roseovarius spongiae]|uniref:Uncharacterized protein n=1 Tax=Roseovarius spongiae TaxID=2320272 RepID=A0A3A8AVW2_9RHOB|nr:hypothetical protein [Roseovarius spongiae]RKF15298.1 hypothetical protein D6850_10755 [Roseovarius spongiae]
MKITILAAICALALTTAPAIAGNLSDPVVAPEVVAADAIANSSEQMQGMLALLTVALIIGASMGAGG